MSKYRNIENQISTYKGKRYLTPTKYPTIPLSNNDTQILTTSGDRLDNLAYQFYGDTSYWIWIVLANPDKVRRDSYYVSPGIQLRIPKNIEEIITKFEKLNK
jgi:nucleoid-associated protein YgaU